MKMERWRDEDGEMKYTTWREFLRCCGCSVAKSCLTLWDSIDCSTPSFPVLHYPQSLLKLMSILRHMQSNLSMDGLMVFVTLGKWQNKLVDSSSLPDSIQSQDALIFPWGTIQRHDYFSKPPHRANSKQWFNDYRLDWTTERISEGEFLFHSLYILYIKQRRKGG